MFKSCSHYILSHCILDLKTIPPGFKKGMNFGSSDVNLNLASSLKQKSKPNDTEEKVMIEPDSSLVIDLADLLKEKGSIFKWIEDEPLPLQKNNSGDLSNSCSFTLSVMSFCVSS